VNVLSVAYPLFRVSPDSSGGAEQILSLVESGIVEAGHCSLVIAAKGSSIAGELIETPDFEGEMTGEVRAWAQSVHRERIRETLRTRPVDLIHFHGLDFDTYLPETAVPKLATLHLPLAWYPQQIFSTPDLTMNCVSDSQARSAPPGVCLPVVKNGIDLERFRTSNGEKGYLLWLGRICPEKGVHLALDSAHRLNLPLIVAGPVHSFPSHVAYFEDQVRPKLDERRRYIGPVGLDEKVDLLSGAICLLVPSLVAETSSLVAMEALASGTPVVAFDSGALPEIVECGVTGFIVSSEEEMAEAVGRISQVSRAACLSYAREHFDKRRMTADYLRSYESL
jgi:glycosyltransferase involved in cell wall biosynthesis